MAIESMEDEIEIQSHPAQWSHLDDVAIGDEEIIDDYVPPKRSRKGLCLMMACLLLVGVVALAIGLAAKSNDDSPSDNTSLSTSQAQAQDFNNDPDPTDSPSSTPTEIPSSPPTATPGSAPPTATKETAPPTVSAIPTATPVSPSPTVSPAPSVSASPTATASAHPTAHPTASPKPTSTAGPTESLAPTANCTDSVASDMECYDRRETIKIEFTNCDPEDDDWVGIYAKDPYRNLTDVGDPILWLWTCGSDDCSGEVYADTLEFGGLSHSGNYIAYLVRYEKDEPYVAYASSEVFRVSSCCSGICDVPGDYNN
mmetsp:Transcript_9438/g.15006  ORF Transcript_9438/g.15006 Transcript_9438/m.15006 type:complete len:313 (+) Transcript_9438:79-1017(+)